MQAHAGQGWIEKWHPVAARALQAFAPLFEGKLEGAQMPPLEGVTQKLDKFYRGYLNGAAVMRIVPDYHPGQGLAPFPMPPAVFVERIKDLADPSTSGSLELGPRATSRHKSRRLLSDFPGRPIS